MKLKNRVAIVTGGSSGIGRGICMEFVKEGAKVVVADVQEYPKPGKYHDQDVTTPVLEEVEKIGGKGLFVRTDMGDEASVRNLMQDAASHFGGIDILVNNAGIFIPGDSQTLGVADWD